MMAFALPHGVTTYLSLPLTQQSVYNGVVSGVTSNTIAVDDTPAPFTTNVSAVTLPYFVKFLSGNEVGRVLLIVANTTSTLTLDTSDHTTGAVVALNTTSFSVEPGDSFEIFPGDTLASVFGSGAAGNPLILTGASSQVASDEVSLYTTVGTAPHTYYYNTIAGFWELAGSVANANNTIIYPYSALTVTRRATHADTTLVLQGRVTPVNASTKTVSHEGVYGSTHYASDVTLSQLQFGSGWRTGDSMSTADNLSVWNAAEGRFDIYYQRPDSTWRKYGNNVTDQSGVVIPAGTVVTIQRRSTLTGAEAFLVSAMPYSLE
jgi:uncharacterized protein (TIGR02597 family)